MRPVIRTGHEPLISRSPVLPIHS